MQYFAGMDISMQETSVCIVDTQGQIIKEAKVPTEPTDMIAFFKALPYPIHKIGMEACTFSSWLGEALRDAGYAAACMNPHHAAAAIQAMQVNKTDRNDARGIAQLVRTGWYREVHIKSGQSRQLQTLIVNRKALVRQRVTVDNTLRGVLKEYGLKVGKVAKGRKLTQRIWELIEGQDYLIAVIEPLLTVRETIVAQTAVLDGMLLKYAERDPICRLFMTIPGVGPLTAITYKAAVDDPNRFEKSSNVGAYLGLTPRKYASGEMDYNGRISKTGDPMAREMLYETAGSMLIHSKKWSSLKVWGLRVAKRSSLKKARVAVARKLAVIMHAMWKTGETFRYSDAPPAAV